jgi:ATP-dependent helicase Lhr and Lhr-like helicase
MMEGVRPDSTEASPLHAWFASRGWTPFPFQEACWAAWGRGESGLLTAPTGAGKTLALVGGLLLNAQTAGLNAQAAGASPPRLRLLWITPLRALARETVLQLSAPIVALGIPWRVEPRTGDTSSSVRARQRASPPEVLVTTPESLSVLLSHPGAEALLGGVEGVVVDEWHELQGSKRGVQVELALARLRRVSPGIRVWGASATLGNPDEAVDALGGLGIPPIAPAPFTPAPFTRVQAPAGNPIRIRSLAAPPERMGRFPWSGHLGLHLLPQVLEALHDTRTALLFTNTRAQAELWFEALAAQRPDWVESGALALHHGALDRTAREQVEDGLRAGSIRLAVCTSTLDLGVDFPAVDRVFQVGSPKGIARLRQRAGRSDHRPGGTPEILGVPTHALELLEFAAVRHALARGTAEPRPAPSAPLDVLAQHLVTLASGDGFRADELVSEVRSTRAYRGLSDEVWGWVLDYVTRGGATLAAYPRYHKVVEVEGVHRVVDPRIARTHRMGIGTLTDEPQVRVRFVRGGTVGTVESQFLARLRPGDTFQLGGRTLELVRLRDAEAHVRVASKPRGAVPRWMGGRLPISEDLGRGILETLERWQGAARDGAPSALRDPEGEALRGLLALQARWSALPAPDALLVERTRSREGEHHFVFPFLGRTVHEGMAALVAHRITRSHPQTLQVAANDYGFELLSPTPLPLEAVGGWHSLLSPDRLLEDLEGALNAAELARRHFREIARIAGLVEPGPPGRAKGAKALQASSSLLFDVLARWDPDHLLLRQARREVLERELDLTRLTAGLGHLQTLSIRTTEPERLTPFAFPLWAERTVAQISTEAWGDRVRRMAESLEREAGGAPGARSAPETAHPPRNHP